MSLTTEELGRKLLGEVEEGDLSEVPTECRQSSRAENVAKHRIDPTTNLGFRPKARRSHLQHSQPRPHHPSLPPEPARRIQQTARTGVDLQHPSGGEDEPALPPSSRSRPPSTPWSCPSQASRTRHSHNNRHRQPLQHHPPNSHPADNPPQPQSPLRRPHRMDDGLRSPHPRPPCPPARAHPTPAIARLPHRHH